MGCGDTESRPGDNAHPLGGRVAKAGADSTDSPAARRMLRAEDGALAFETHWNWQGDRPDGAVVPAPLAALIEQSGWIIDIDRPPNGAGEISAPRSEEHTSELQSLMRISYAVFCLKKKTNTIKKNNKQTQSRHTQRV